MRCETQPSDHQPGRAWAGWMIAFPDLMLCPDLPPSSVLSAVSLLRATGSSTWLNSSHECERPAWMPSGADASRKAVNLRGPPYPCRNSGKHSGLRLRMHSSGHSGTKYPPMSQSTSHLAICDAKALMRQAGSCTYSLRLDIGPNRRSRGWTMIDRRLGALQAYRRRSGRGLATGGRWAEWRVAGRVLGPRGWLGCGARGHDRPG